METALPGSPRVSGSARVRFPAQAAAAGEGGGVGGPWLLPPEPAGGSGEPCPGRAAERVPPAALAWRRPRVSPLPGERS